MDKKEKKSLPEPRTYTVEQIAAMLNIGRTTAYQLVKQEEFRIVRIGNAIRVSKKSFDEWLESLGIVNIARNAVGFKKPMAFFYTHF